MVKDQIVSIITDYKKPIQKDTLVDILIKQRFPNSTNGIFYGLRNGLELDFIVLI